MKVLLTGASGFLGSSLALKLRTLGHDVALILRSSSKVERLQGLDLEFEISRYVDRNEVPELVSQIKPNVVIHTACLYGRHGEDTLQLTDVNIQFGLQIIQALMSLGRPATFINTDTVLSPTVSAYALCKHQFSQWGRLLAAQSMGKTRFVNVRLQHMYGPGDDKSKFATLIINSFLQNEPLLKLTLGEQKRDFIYIDDAVSAYTTLLERLKELDPVFDVDVGSGVAPKVREFVETAHRLIGSNTILQFGALPYRDNEDMHCQADLTKMKRLGWKPVYDIESGLAKTLALEF